MFSLKKRGHYHRAHIAMQRTKHPNCYYVQQRLCFAQRDQATVDGRRSQPSAKEAPVRGAGVHSSTWKSYTIRLYQVCSTRYFLFFSTRSFRELGAAGGRTSPQTFEQSSEKLCGDENRPCALPMRPGAARSTSSWPQKRWCLEIQNTYTAVPGYSYTR